MGMLEDLKTVQKARDDIKQALMGGVTDISNDITTYADKIKWLIDNPSSKPMTVKIELVDASNFTVGFSGKVGTVIVEGGTPPYTYYDPNFELQGTIEVYSCYMTGNTIMTSDSLGKGVYEIKATVRDSKGMTATSPKYTVTIKGIDIADA